MPPRIIEENRFCVLDLETTGLSIHRDEIVQVAFIQIDHGRPALQAAVYVQPSRPITDGAMSAHGITWDLLEHAQPFAAVWRDVEVLIGDRCLIGYGAARFDVPILSRQLGEVGRVFDRAVIDVLPWERKFGGKGKHNLRAAAERWGVPAFVQHEALADCRMCWEVFVKLAEQHPELGDATLSDILTLRPAPPLPADMQL